MSKVHAGYSERQAERTLPRRESDGYLQHVTIPPESNPERPEPTAIGEPPLPAIRPLASLEDYAACVALQEETWGAGFSERVPTAILKVSQRIGGVTAGAFDEDGRMLGFVFGMTGVEGGQLVHWSDMLAVRPELHNHGLGRRLKEYQRDVLRQIGVRRIYWTFDPLVARNAHFNFNRLGVYVVEYVENMYGGNTASALHRGVGTDRFVVAWPIGENAPSYLTGERTPGIAGGAPVVNTGGELNLPGDATPVRIEVPCDIAAVQSRAVGEAAVWRSSTRQAFRAAEHAGYVVSGFYRDAAAGRCFYLLLHSDQRNQ
jgi:predicted GNAT superfamily acetyltransferase